MSPCFNTQYISYSRGGVQKGCMFALGSGNLLCGRAVPQVWIVDIVVSGKHVRRSPTQYPTENKALRRSSSLIMGYLKSEICCRLRSGVWTVMLTASRVQPSYDFDAFGSGFRHKVLSPTRTLNQKPLKRVLGIACSALSGCWRSSFVWRVWGVSCRQAARLPMKAADVTM